ncbi:MAG: rod-binding protein [Planctomycetaceae bacterium]|nr:rod-binding protein [Planctomycetaceae bacterium]
MNATPMLSVPATLMPKTVSPNPAEADAASVGKAAREFESVMMSMMLKTMRESMSQDMFSGDQSDTFGGMFDMFLGQHLAEHGGVGLSRLVADAAALKNSDPVRSENDDEARKTYQRVQAATK